MLLGALIVCAQQPDGVEVVKASWTKVRIGWERDPFSGPLENFDEMRSRTRNERRVAMGGGERAKREAKADAANLEKKRQQKPSEYYFIYKAKIKNNAASAITEIDWDHVFYERGTKTSWAGTFPAPRQMGPGKTRELLLRSRHSDPYGQRLPLKPRRARSIH